MRRLFLDKVTRDFNENLDTALGPRCFDNCSDIDEICNLIKTSKIINERKYNRFDLINLREKLYKKYSLTISQYLKRTNTNDFPQIFYEDMSRAWLLHFLDFLIFSQNLVAACLKKYSNKKIQVVQYYKDQNLQCENTLDFVKKIFNKRYLSSFILFLIKNNKPKNWQIVCLNNKIKSYEIKISPNEQLIIKKKNLFDYVKNKIKNLIFFNCQEIYGLNIFQKAFLSFYFSIKKPLNKSIRYKKSIFNKKKGKNLKGFHLPKNIEEILRICIPASLKNIKPANNKRNNYGKIILTSGGPLLYDDEKKAEFYIHKLNGGVIFSQQHGSNYNDADDNPYAGCEMMFDGLISWGYKKHDNYKGRIIPLPSPQLCFKRKYNNDNILFCSTENWYFNPRISGKSFDFTSKRINNTIIFLKNIKNAIFKKVYFKEHFAFHFSEKKFLDKKLSNINYTNNAPETFLQSSKMVILNNISTMFFKSMAANTPTLVIMNDYGLLTKSALRMFKLLEEKNIIFTDPLRAAKFINKNFDQIENWWFSKDLQKMRIKFCSNFALYNKSPFKIWMNFFYNIR